MPEPRVILTHSTLNRVLTRMAHEIAEKNEDSEQVILVGVPRGGTLLAARLARLLEDIWHHPVPAGSVDVSMHRDDLGSQVAPVVHDTTLPCDIAGRTVVLVDVVFFSGRTVRAALDALHDFGRPKRIQLAVLVDRGHRELPIKPDFVGKNLPTSRQERVDVRFEEDQGEDAVYLYRSKTP